MDENETFPQKYIVAKVKFEQDKEFNFDDLNVMEQHVFDITKEAEYLTANCPELHLIVSAPNWKALEKKIENVYEQKVIEDLKDD